MNPTSNASVLEVRSLAAGYRPGQPVLHGIDADARAGQLTALIGPNASGKTTLLRAMLGQLRADVGSVKLEGRAVKSWPAEELARRVAYMPQRGGGRFGYSVQQMVAMGRFAHQDSRFVGEAMTRCGISEIADHDAQRLSGGQQQRVMLARAWAQSRGGAVLLADEPVSSLDMGHAHETMALLHAMTREGLAVVVVLHGLELAARWADHVWLLDQGRLVAAGPTRQVMDRSALESVYRVRLAETQIDGRPLFSVLGPAG